MSSEVKGLATCLAIDCETKEGKKLCKKLKVTTSSFVLKHYKDGEFHKDYDRAVTVKSMVTFLKVGPLLVASSSDVNYQRTPLGICHGKKTLQLKT